MAVLQILCSQSDVELGEKVSLLARVSGATPKSTVVVDITEPGSGLRWPGTVHVNGQGVGAGISSDVVLPGVAGTVTLVTLTGTAVSSAGDAFAPVATSARVHG